MPRRTTPTCARARRLRTQRGTAMVEAVIALPMLITTLLGITYVHRLCAAKQQSLLDARRTAWTQALSGCDAGPSASGDDQGRHAQLIRDYVAQTNTRADPGTLGKIPIIGSTLANLVLPGTTGSAQISLPRPAFLRAPAATGAVNATPTSATGSSATSSANGSAADSVNANGNTNSATATDTLSTSSYLACNEPHRDAHADAMQIFEDFIKSAIGL